MSVTFKLTLACASALLISACANQYGANPYAANTYPAAYPNYPNTTNTAPNPNDADAFESQNDRTALDDRNDDSAPNAAQNANVANDQDDENEDASEQGNNDLPRFSDDRVSVEREGQGMRVGLPDEILFARDSASLNTEARDLLGVVVANLSGRYRDMEIAVNGYTDTAGSRDHNDALSEERAEAVADELVRLGVDASRIRTRGFGESNLRVDTADGVRQPQNRRVEIVLQPASG